MALMLSLLTHLSKACTAFLPSEYVNTATPSASLGCRPPSPRLTPSGSDSFWDPACPSRTECLGEAIRF